MPLPVSSSPHFSHSASYPHRPTHTLTSPKQYWVTDALGLYELLLLCELVGAQPQVSVFTGCVGSSQGRQTDVWVGRRQSRQAVRPASTTVACIGTSQPARMHACVGLGAEVGDGRTRQTVNTNCHAACCQSVVRWAGRWAGRWVDRLAVRCGLGGGHDGRCLHWHMGDTQYSVDFRYHLDAPSYPQGGEARGLAPRCAQAALD